MRLRKKNNKRTSSVYCMPSTLTNSYIFMISLDPLNLADIKFILQKRKMRVIGFSLKLHEQSYFVGEKKLA
jgi:hypothetical protein